MNEFSLIGRTLGSLFYRDITEPVMQPLYQLIKSGKFAEEWPLLQDELFAELQQEEADFISQDYQQLFIADGAIFPYRSHYIKEGENAQWEQFLQEIGMEVSKTAKDHFGVFLLAASWIEDHELDNQFQIRLFDYFLLPWSDQFLQLVEQRANSKFYQALSTITREAISAMHEALMTTVD